jgi:hypothetical protein
MAIEFPIRIEREAGTKSFDPSSIPDSFPSNQNFPQFKLTPGTKTGQECKQYRLAEIGGWPEQKGAMETRCVDAGWPIGRLCADVPVIYNRTCTKFVYVSVCYPTGMWADVEECIKGAALASAVAAVISSPGSAGPAFELALKGCLAAKGVAWADQVSVTAGADSECGDWH